MLCLPVTNDQPGVAQRVQWLGLGKVLPAKRVNAERLRQLVREMINDDQIRRNVLSRQAELSSVDGPGLAADIVETALHNPAQLMSMSSGWQKNLT